jgi:hypothetical protein
MGSGASKQLKCPKEYDDGKFKVILQLYDKLDKDGDHVVETDEIKEISKLHIDNKIRSLQKDILKEAHVYEQNILQIEFQKNQKIKLAEEEAKLNIQSEKENNELRKSQLNEKIQNYSNLSEEERCKKFMTAVTDSNKHIEFWKFFEYMKNKTDDIKNIEF